MCHSLISELLLFSFVNKNTKRYESWETKCFFIVIKKCCRTTKRRNDELVIDQYFSCWFRFFDSFHIVSKHQYHRGKNVEFEWRKTWFDFFLAERFGRRWQFFCQRLCEVRNGKSNWKKRKPTNINFDFLSQATLYTFFTLTNIFAPALVTFVGPGMAMLVAAISYT